MAGSSPEADALWKAHQRRQSARMGATGIVWPRVNMPARDPYALRFLIVLVLALSLLIAGSSWSARLREALAPVLNPPVPADVEIDAWVEPPAYTGLPPIPLVRGRRAGDSQPAPDERQMAEVPLGSTLVVRVVGFDGRPLLEVTPDDRSARTPPVRFTHEEAVVEGRAPVAEALSARLVLRGQPLGQWRLSVLADQPPAAELPTPPEPTNTASLRFQYGVADDYGVTAARALLTLVPRDAEEAIRFAEAASDKPPSADQGGIQSNEPDDGPGADQAPTLAPGQNTDGSTPIGSEPASWPNPGRAVIVDLPVSGRGGGISQETAIENLADHPWAGREVLVQIEVEDAAGQRGTSQGQRVTLPERVFLNPLAQSLAELRRALARDPGSAFRVAAALDGLTVEPETSLGEDTIVYLGLRTAYWRLTHDPELPETREVFDLLWDLALRVEDGSVADSLERLREIQKRLSDALLRDAPQAEIRQLMAQLREAMDQYLADLMNQADQASSGDPSAPTLGSDDLASLLSSIQQLSDMGANAQARQMLAELQQLLEGLTPQAGAGGSGNGQTSPQVQALNEALSELSDIISDQRQTLDETYRQTNPPAHDSPLGLNGSLEEAFREAFGDRLGSNPFKRRGEDQSGMDPFLNTPGGETWGKGSNGGPGQSQQGQQGQQQRGGAPKPSASGSAEGSALAQDQQSLADRLQALREQLEAAGLAAPEGLAPAGEAMGRAGEALGADDFGTAFSQQQDALNSLRAAAEQMARDALRRQGRGRGVAGSNPLGGQGPGSGLSTTGGVRIPDQGDLQRARAILKELRRRIGDPSRPADELDYLDRLLEQF